MSQPNGSREHDIVLFGATGFTGALTAEYLAKNAPDGCRWALAGRNRDKLEAVRARLAEIDPSLADLPLLHADVNDRESLRAVAEGARVVITTVGPYIEYGEPLVAACAEAGTDYVDLTGEPEFADRMYVAHHERAKETGARIVHACGLDSIPHDLGAWFTVGRTYGMTGPFAAVAAMLACGILMVLWSLIVDKVHLRPSTGIDWSRKRPIAATFEVSVTKIAGLWATFASA